jgi:hypothetical protein
VGYTPGRKGLTRKLGSQPLLGTASRRTNQPDSVTPAVTGVCASSFTIILFVVHMCTLLQATSERDRKQPSWGDILSEMIETGFVRYDMYDKAHTVLLLLVLTSMRVMSE